MPREVDHVALTDRPLQPVVEDELRAEAARLGEAGEGWEEVGVRALLRVDAFAA
jgi:hypothetical protein